MYGEKLHSCGLTAKVWGLKPSYSAAYACHPHQSEYQTLQPCSCTCNPQLQDTGNDSGTSLKYLVHSQHIVFYLSVKDNIRISCMHVVLYDTYVHTCNTCRYVLYIQTFL